MKNKKLNAGSSDDFKKSLEDIGRDSNVEDDVVDFLEKMWIGNKNNPKVKTAKNVTDNLTDSTVDNPPVPAVNPDYPDLETVDYADDEAFGVDQKNDGSNNNNLKRLIDLQMNLNYPAGNQPTAGTSQTNKKQAEKSKARENLKAHQAKITNAKNLGVLIAKKGYVTRENLPELVKKLASLDNTAYSLVREIMEMVEAKAATEGRQAKASANTSPDVLSQPIHLAKPAPRGSNLVDSLSSAPWEGAPPKGYNHNKYTNEGQDL